jgi:hypothetical protein
MPLLEHLVGVAEEAAEAQELMLTIQTTMTALLVVVVVHLMVVLVVQVDTLMHNITPQDLVLTEVQVVVVVAEVVVEV